MPAPRKRNERGSLPWAVPAPDHDRDLFADVPDWYADAACTKPGVDPEIFFIEKGGSSTPAKKVCLGCTVRATCLEDSIARRDQDGIWGGLSERERRKIWQAADREAAQGVPMEATA